MGLKDAAKRLMEKAGVPVVPGYHGEAQEIVVLASKAREIGYPVLIKARAGGGGKGMRRVDDPDRFAEELAAARREAKAAFGDDRVLVEKYVDKPRHIEIQVFGDNHGGAVHLFERDCSAQRRHQKVIEEAPAPDMTAEMRKAMTDAAVKAAKAIHYSGAGTIEFIVDASHGLKPDRFWFMEMNTRLQVEHPVTEMVTGLDLVEWQLRVAAGEKLPKSQKEITLSGHAFEARIYAEDASKGFLPAIGTLHHLRFPDRAEGGTVRIETGVREGDAISPYYDPMIAKLVVHGDDRETALGALADALDHVRIAGSITNTAFLAALARDPDFASGNVDTGLIGRKQEELTRTRPAGAAVKALAALAVASAESGGRQSADPWSSFTGYAHFHPISRRAALAYGEEPVDARVTARGGGRFEAEVQGASFNFSADAVSGRAALWPGHVTVFDGPSGYTFSAPDPLARDTDAASGAASLRAPMPGLVKIVRAAAGDMVTKGQPLLILEAMKMEHTIAAPHDGLITEIASEGAQVTDGTVLVRFKEEETA
jgi:3-methylcrotonyl-CoA carboxylase alpha subunit